MGGTHKVFVRAVAPNPIEGVAIMSAIITATAYIGDEPMKDHTDEVILWSTESSTDLPSEYLGECAAIALSKAWRTGIDPALTEGFHLRLTFK